MTSHQNGAVVIRNPGNSKRPPLPPAHQNVAGASPSNNDSFPDSPNSERSASRASTTGRGYWKHHLFVLQESSPKPKAVQCARPVSHRPPYYENEFHGLISRETADRLLASIGEGSYLIRESQRSPGMYTLCMRFDEQTKNYKLFYDGQHYVGEKRFDTLDQLVADGLICMYMDKHAADYIRRMTDEATYEESPYSQYQRMTQRQNKRRTPSNSPLHTELRQRHSSQNSVRSVESEQPRHKAHHFKSHTFRIASFCDYCGNFMWGLVQQGLRCEDCGFACHKKCSEKTRLDCQPDLKYVKRTFNVDMTTLCMAHGRSVPPIVEHCIYQVENRGLNVEGIYRISGSHDEIDKLRLSFDLGASNVDLSSNKIDDIHSIAGLLKLYFRLLPQPLITFSVYRLILQVLRQYRAEFERTKAIKRTLEELPISHLETLKILVRHLALVASHSNVNKMTTENLAVIFAPTILCHSSPQNVLFALPQQEQYVLQYLMVNCNKLFG